MQNFKLFFSFIADSRLMKGPKSAKSMTYALHFAFLGVL